MPSADFAAAQERIAARRAQRARTQHEQSTRQSSAITSRLPFPFNRLSSSGLSIWDTIKGREGSHPEFRVGQVDAELLDDELLDLLKGQVSEGLKYFGTHVADTWSAEILLGLRLVLFKLSIWNNDASYGAHLQGLRYTDARSSALNRPRPTSWQKAAYGIITVGGRYAWTKWEEYLLATSEDYTHPQSETLQFANHLTEQLSSAHDFASLFSFLIFLVNGRYRTLTDRLLRLRLTPTSHSTSREVSFEYLNRQLVWHAFTEFLLFLLPLVGISRWRRILSRTFRKLHTSFLAFIGRGPSPQDATDNDESHPSGELSFLPLRTCAICYRDQNPTTTSEADILTQSAAGGGIVGSAATDITNPYEAVPCGCIYCFACIAQRIANEEGEGWTCLRCGEQIKECMAWDGDVIETRRSIRTPSHSTSASATGAPAKTVGFANTTTHDDDDEEEEEEDEKSLLNTIDPIPEHDDDEHDHDTEMSGIAASAEGSLGIQGTRGIHLGQSLSLDESAEWARANSNDSDEDEQSEEYEEDEEEEGNGLDYA